MPGFDITVGVSGKGAGCARLIAIPICVGPKENCQKS